MRALGHVSAAAWLMVVAPTAAQASPFDPLDATSSGAH